MEDWMQSVTTEEVEYGLLLVFRFDHEICA